MKVLILLALLGIRASGKVITDEDIEELNRLIPNGQWRAGRVFESTEDVLPLLGDWPLTQQEDEKVYRIGSLETKDYEAPEAFDAREEWPQCQSIGTVWDQANCGSCWAVSSAGVISDRICIHTGKQVMVSAQQLMTCCDNCSKKGGCSGGSRKEAILYWKNTGLVSGGGYGMNDTCQPYSLPKCTGGQLGPLHCYPKCPKPLETTPPCKEKCTNEEYETTFEEDKNYADDAYNVENDEKAIMKEIQTNGPLAAHLTIYTDFLCYTEGIYSHVSGGIQGYHAVRIIGWGVENGVKYWLVANSWNECWGDKGFFRVKKGVNECGIESDFFAGMPK